jgi:hypothetical protein
LAGFLTVGLEVLSALRPAMVVSCASEFYHRTSEPSDAGGPARSHCQLAWPAHLPLLNTQQAAKSFSDSRDCGARECGIWFPLTRIGKLTCCGRNETARDGELRRSNSAADVSNALRPAGSHRLSES